MHFSIQTAKRTRIDHGVKAQHWTIDGEYDKNKFKTVYKTLEECVEIANDLGGISSTTHDEVNPTSPWPELEKMRKRLEKKGFSLKERLAVYPKYYSWLNEKLLEKTLLKK